MRHVFGVYGLWLCLTRRVDWRTGLWALLLWPISGLGVTAGAHRLWTHQSYKASGFLEALLVVMFSIADQGSIEGWSLTHAMHHVASDTPWDPHNRRAGWWHAHFGWLFSAQRFRLPSSEYKRVIQGLGPAVRTHDRHFQVWDPLFSHLMPSLVATLWGDAVGGFFVAGALRWMAVQHITFFVNSVAHGPLEVDDSWAFNPQAAGVGPRVSLLTTFLALGEGWHDYHHLFPWDYAAAELDEWDQWNPTKVFIDLCCAMGLASHRRRCSTRLQQARRLQLLGKAVDSSETTFKVLGPPMMRHRVSQSTKTENGSS